MVGLPHPQPPTTASIPQLMTLQESIWIQLTPMTVKTLLRLLWTSSVTMKLMSDGATTLSRTWARSVNGLLLKKAKVTRCKVSTSITEAMSISLFQSKLTLSLKTIPLLLDRSRSLRLTKQKHLKSGHSPLPTPIVVHLNSVC